MMQYENLSVFYDRLTEDQPYDKWLSIIKDTLHAAQAHSILDIGCGTGNLTQFLPQLATEVVGMDLSPEMIARAQQKSEHVNWIHGDMTAFNLNRQFDLVTILCDSLNYVVEEADVMATFNHVFHHLNQQGSFIFDVHSIYKMDTQFNQQVYLDDREDLTLVWQTETGELPHSVWHDLTFFIRTEDGKYLRRDESQFQRTLEKAQYIEMLKAVGFKDIETFYDFDYSNKNSESDRLFFIAKK
ncbi:class I SAM-dependent methyltransferase [Staphylococcus coagulans]|uniref:class I SAM-dependent DNA methyltransferase n=1 Tax=Staphylococcus coagulans TaxID=74706 RepID=UPI00315B3A39